MRSKTPQDSFFFFLVLLTQYENCCEVVLILIEMISFVPVLKAILIT